jgi:Zinc finger, C3HC4 type (RING finger)
MEQDSIIASIKQKQKQWMREREIELQKEGMPSLSASELVNALTDKITSQLPKSQKKIDKSVADEVETNTCSICFELMLPKAHSPILLFPCGHTFCKECVEHAFRSGQKKCPWCREKITSHAVNLSLQNIIVAYARQNDIKVNLEPDKPDNDYKKQLEMYELRARILKEEKNSNINQLKVLEGCIRNEENSLSILKNEEKKIADRIKAAEQELELVNDHLKKAEVSIDKLYKEVDSKQRTIELIDETLGPVEREIRRVAAILDIQGEN